MGIGAAIKVLNGMTSAGVIKKYAIGGAVAAFLYIEPGATFDLDIFVAFEPGPSGLLTLGPIYSYLQGLGHRPQHEAIMIEGWAVQFLPPANDLVSEALEQSKEVEIDSEKTRVFTAEHLMAISLQTGRPKDLARLVQFVQEGAVEETRLMDVLGRHGLKAKFADFKRKFFPRTTSQ